ncbi:hypothetical protein J4481_00775 [Candidatus Pacearchaeota archaeon]|nr:hypothetical protein [Candidatus Pacearchaeota archaeon]
MAIEDIRFNDKTTRVKSWFPRGFISTVLMPDGHFETAVFTDGVYEDEYYPFNWFSPIACKHAEDIEQASRNHRVFEATYLTPDRYFYYKRLASSD